MIDMPLLNTNYAHEDLTGVFISDLVLQILAYVAETERAFIKQRQAEGIVAAKAKGVRFGCKKTDLPDDFERYYKMWCNGEISLRKVAEALHMNHSTLESALGGVLFIDEAYTLYAGKDNSNDFGIEAIDEILKFMEDHRQDIVLIFAGYTHSMEQFLESNEGLKSRIPNTFTFEDYTQEELVRIGLDDLYAQKYEIDEKAYTDLVYKQYSESNDNSNGRWVRNLNEKLIRKMAIRVSRDPNANLVLITQEDIDAV